MLSWEEAAKESKGNRAVATYGLVQDRRGHYVKAQIVKVEGRDGRLVYWKTTRLIRLATTQEVDKTQGWIPF